MQSGNSPLMLAAHEGYTEIVKLLLKQKDIQLNVTNSVIRPQL